MPIHFFEREQIIQATPEEAWEFFSNPANLARITPPSLDFRVLSALPPRMHAGLMIAYRVRPLLGIAMSWLTEITQVNEPTYFVDDQRIGPYRVWHHEHRFEDMGDGQVRVTDRVTYALRGGWLAEPIHRWIVRPELQRIFAYREKVVAELFRATPRPATH